MATTEDGTETQALLRTGGQYIESLRDDRVVFYKGERVEDVTTHEATAGGIRQIADIYDLQFDPEAQKVLTYVREDGKRVTVVLPHPEDQGRPALPSRGHQVRRAPVLRHGGPRHRHDRHAAARDARPSCPRSSASAPSTPRTSTGSCATTRRTTSASGRRSSTRRATAHAPSGTKPETQAPERATARIVDENSDGHLHQRREGRGDGGPPVERDDHRELPSAAGRGELLGLRPGRLARPQDVPARGGAPPGRRRVRPPAHLARRGDRVDRRLRPPLRAARAHPRAQQALAARRELLQRVGAPGALVHLHAHRREGGALRRAGAAHRRHPRARRGRGRPAARGRHPRVQPDPPGHADRRRGAGGSVGGRRHDARRERGHGRPQLRAATTSRGSCTSCRTSAARG